MKNPSRSRHGIESPCVSARLFQSRQLVIEPPRVCRGLGSGHTVVVSNNGARVMEGGNFRSYKKRITHFKVP